MWLPTRCESVGSAADSVRRCGATGSAADSDSRSADERALESADWRARGRLRWQGSRMRIFGGKPKSASTIPSAGHAGDDQLLAQIAQHSDLDAGRHWVHFVYFANEDAARAAAGQISQAGWDIQRVDPSADGGPEWAVIAEQH